MAGEKPATIPHASGPFVTELGVELVSRGEGRAHIWVDLQDWMRNARGFVHGGVLSTLADVAAGHAALSKVESSGQTVMTVELHTSFLAPIRHGAIEGFGEIIHEGRSLLRVRATLRASERNTALVDAVACFMILPASAV